MFWVDMLMFLPTSKLKFWFFWFLRGIWVFIHNPINIAPPQNKNILILKSNTTLGLFGR